ncbi:hypothetical protein [Alienimonas chondri]|uniref:hypothetical protein n=1 Tax=Alienimonas chondri TaxID=2681879 RepID=UPI0014878AD8|nr:hypothetical protein [Alienimonas chondri]
MAATPFAATLACLTASVYAPPGPPGVGLFLDWQGWFCLCLSNLLTLGPFGLLPGWIAGRRQAGERIAFRVSGAAGFVCTGVAAFLLWRFFLFAASQ